VLLERGDIASADIRGIAYTHWHPDHVGNTDMFRTESTTVVSGRGGVLRMATPQSILYFGAQVPAWPSIMLPEQEIFAAADLQQSGVELAYYPYSHTSTDLAVRIPGERVMVMGDLVAEGFLPFTDVENGGTMRGLVATVQTALDRLPDDYLIVPGHGRIMTKPEVQALVNMTRSSIDYVEQRMDAGTTLEQIQADAVLAPDQGGLVQAAHDLANPMIGIPAFVQWIHQDLTLRDATALQAARRMAREESVTGREMVSIVREAIGSGANAAGAAYDTLKFEFVELQNIDANAPVHVILEPRALAVFAVYDRFVAAARGEGRTNLTAAEMTSLDREMNAAARM
jgi:glyoxylase-like metal-dependent hydrolase (beta-lactamase superfamily II)